MLAVIAASIDPGDTNRDGSASGFVIAGIFIAVVVIALVIMKIRNR